jgi:hypothetical protein
LEFPGLYDIWQLEKSSEGYKVIWEYSEVQTPFSEVKTTVLFLTSSCSKLPRLRNKNASYLSYKLNLIFFPSRSGRRRQGELCQMRLAPPPPPPPPPPSSSTHFAALLSDHEILGIGKSLSSLTSDGAGVRIQGLSAGFQGRHTLVPAASASHQHGRPVTGLESELSYFTMRHPISLSLSFALSFFLPPSPSLPFFLPPCLPPSLFPSLSPSSTVSLSNAHLRTDCDTHTRGAHRHADSGTHTL